jgi:hypothetical protein
MLRNSLPFIELQYLLHLNVAICIRTPCILDVSEWNNASICPQTLKTTISIAQLLNPQIPYITLFTRTHPCASSKVSIIYFISLHPTTLSPVNILSFLPYADLPLNFLTIVRAHLNSLRHLYVPLVSSCLLLLPEYFWWRDKTKNSLLYNFLHL